MTVLEALALESATRDVSKERLTLKKSGRALAFLEPHIQLPWAIPQCRHSLEGEEEHPYSMIEGQQQVLRATFESIRKSVRELIGRKIDALVREFHEDRIWLRLNAWLGSGDFEGAVGFSPNETLTRSGTRVGAGSYPA